MTARVMTHPVRQPAAGPATVAGGAIPTLNGVRAVAVGLVFTAHGGLEHVVPGGLGVTLFFVLSGFLITTLLRREWQARQRLDLRAFYLRRFLRLSPPLVLAVMLGALLAGSGLVHGGFSRAGLLATLFYAGNYFIIAHDFEGLPAGLGVVWSLAVEEHFYFVYPPLALWLLPRHRTTQIAVLGSLALTVLVWRCWLATHGASAAHLLMATDTRIDAILIGCLLAVGWNPLDGTPAGSRSIACAALAILLLTLVVRDPLFRLTLRYTVQGVAVAVLLHSCVVGARQAAFRWLDHPLLFYLGSISYTIYLVHQLMLGVVAGQWPAAPLALRLLLAAGLTLAVAEPVRRLVDEPLARLRRRLHRETAR